MTMRQSTPTPVRHTEPWDGESGPLPVWCTGVLSGMFPVLLLMVTVSSGLPGWLVHLLGAPVGFVLLGATMHVGKVPDTQRALLSCVALGAIALPYAALNAVMFAELAPGGLPRAESVALYLSGAVGLVWWRWYGRPRIIDPRLCARCGYELPATGSDPRTCPECGSTQVGPIATDEELAPGSFYLRLEFSPAPRRCTPVACWTAAASVFGYLEVEIAPPIICKAALRKAEVVDRLFLPMPLDWHGESLTTAERITLSRTLAGDSWDRGRVREEECRDFGEGVISRTVEG